MRLTLIPSPRIDRIVQTSFMAIYLVCFLLGRNNHENGLLIIAFLLTIPWGGYNVLLSLLPSIIGRKSNPTFHKIRIGYLLLALSYFPLTRFVHTYEGGQMLATFTGMIQDDFITAVPFGLAFVYWIITMSDRTRKS
jgi:hypothetical protein